MDDNPGQLADTMVARSVVSRWAWCEHRHEHENGYGAAIVAPAALSV